MSRIAEVEASVSALKASVEKLIAAEGQPADVGLTSAEVDATLVSLKSIKDAVDAALPVAPQA